MLQGMSKEDKFKNHPSLTVVKEDDLCEGNALGYMEIKELGIKLFCELKGLVIFKVDSSRKLNVEGIEVLTNVGITGLQKESYLYCIGIIPIIACFSFLLHT